MFAKSCTGGRQQTCAIFAAISHMYTNLLKGSIQQTRGSDSEKYEYKVNDSTCNINVLVKTNKILEKYVNGIYNDESVTHIRAALATTSSNINEFLLLPHEAM